MRALTIIQPWPYAMVCLPPHERKPVENRTWAAPSHLIGQRIAIHAGLKPVDLGAVQSIEREVGVVIDPDKCVRGAIIGTGLLIGSVSHGLQGEFIVRRIDAIKAAYESVYFTGPYGHVYADVHALVKPIECKGAQGYWTVPDDIAAQIGGGA